MLGKFTKDTLITLIAKVLLLVLGIGTSIIVARVLGPGGKGIYSLAILFPTLLITFTNLGIGPASVYFIGQKKYTSKEVFGANIIYSVLISIFAILFNNYLLFRRKIISKSEDRISIFSSFPGSFLYFFNFCDRYFIGTSKN